MAMFIMFTNIGGIWGSQMFRAHDAPAYTMGWTAIVAVESFVLILVICANCMYWWLNKKDRGTEADVQSKRMEF